MSHEDFVQYLSEGTVIAGHQVSLSGNDQGCTLRLHPSAELPVAFVANEGFESRMEKVAAAVRQLGAQRTAA